MARASDIFITSDGAADRQVRRMLRRRVVSRGCLRERRLVDNSLVLCRNVLFWKSYSSNCIF